MALAWTGILAFLEFERVSLGLNEGSVDEWLWEYELMIRHGYELMIR